MVPVHLNLTARRRSHPTRRKLRFQLEALEPRVLLDGDAPGPITFESIPGDGPRDGLAIASQFQATYGVTFELEGGGVPVLALAGGTATAFTSGPADADADLPAAGQPVGSFFLTDDGTVGGPPAPLVVRYQQPVAQASGTVLDIDTTTEEFTVFHSDGTPGYYNQALGRLLDGTSSLFPVTTDPTINPAPEPDLSTVAGLLGNWLTANPLPLNANWSFQAVPTNWPLQTETAMVYEIDAGPGGVRNLKGFFGVDNGIFVWLNGQYKFGALAPGGVGRYEYSDIPLGDLAPGKNYLQVLREDHGTANGFAIRITGDLVPADGWLVEARDAAGQTIDRLQLGPQSFGAGDGRAADWAFSHATADIHSVRLSYVGTIRQRVGFAFDNFASAVGVTVPVPPPPSEPDRVIDLTGVTQPVDITFLLSVLLDQRREAKAGQWRQRVRIFELAKLNYSGPIVLVLDSLPKRVKLRNRTGYTRGGSPYVLLQARPGELRSFAGVQTLFRFASATRPRYRLRVLAGLPLLEQQPPE